MSEANELLRKDELVVVQSIYGDDWHEIPPVKTAWGTEVEAGWWGVTVRAEEGRVSVQLRGRYTKKYPEQPPYLKLFEPIGLTGDHVRTLLRLLQDKARSLVGEVMIYDLAMLAEHWIADNHVPMPKAGEPQRTLMEERALREEAQRAAEEAQSQADYEKSLVAAAEQERLLNEKIRLDDSLKREKREREALQGLERKRQLALDALDDGDLASREISLDHPISVDGYVDQGQWSSWSLYGGRKCLLWTSYDAEPVIKDGSVDPNFVKTGLPTLEVQVIDFSKPFYSSDHGKKRIDSLVSEIKRLQEIRSDHVARIYAVKRDKSPKGWERVMVFVEKPKTSMLLHDWLPADGFDESTAKHYYNQVMTGLAAVHKHNSTQRLFASQFVMMSRPSNGQHVVKLLGTGYAKRIMDLHKSNPFLKNFQDVNSESWASPDEMNHPHDYTPKRDIWNSAILFVELLFGSQANWTYPNLHFLWENRTMSPALYEVLDSIMTDQAKKRPTADEILDKLAELDLDVTHVQPQRPKIITAASNNSLGKRQSRHESADMRKSPSSAALTLPQHGLGPSRYRTDYEEVEKLGQGGFGMVVKARHRFGDQFYAVKKIKLRTDDRRRVTEKEIQILPGLSHKHIVRYYYCWIEDPPKPVVEADDAESTESASSVPAVDEISDPFAPPDPKDPFAYNGEQSHSKSVSFPPVRFSLATRRFDEATSSDEDDSGSDSETSDEEEDSGEETESEHPVVRAQQAQKQVQNGHGPPTQSSAITGSTNSDPTAFRTLYIVMEFVDNGTLRELIDDNRLTVEDSWRLFKEVLDALSYLHSQRVVHRDLKPANILINQEGRAIVADFGLSTFTSTATVETVDPAQAGSLSGTKTSNIGTAAYIAPEVMSGRSYDQKADLYSLGVIFFEMNFPPMMGQERAQIISGIRDPKIIFPRSWPADREKQHDFVKWLLAHDPSARPSADVALASPLMPMELKEPDQHHKAIFSLTADRTSERYEQLVRALFQRDQSGPDNLVNERASNWLYDHERAHNEEAAEVWSAVIIKRLKDLFVRHGAQETFLPPLLPETKLLESFPHIKPVRLLDHSGRLVQLVGCDLVAMARSAPRRRIGRAKRFHVGMEYSEIMLGRQPAKSAEVCFDIVSPLQSAASEVEAIEVVDKIIAEFRGGKSAPEDAGYEFHISHESVLSAILHLVPSATRQRVRAVLRSIGVDFNYEKCKDKVKAALRNIDGVPPTAISSIEACCITGDFVTVRSNLELVFASAARSTRDQLKRALDDMANVVGLLGCIPIGRKILFRPLLAHNAEYFRGGFMFEAVRKGRRRDVLAFGGRYDTLLEHFDISQSRPTARYGVGLSVSVNHLVQMVSGYESALAKDLMAREKEEERSFGFWTPSRCDVYVAAGVQVDLSVRIKIVAELWRNGISADLQYDDDRTLEDLAAECEEQSTPFLVLPRASRSEVKIRSILRRSEEEVSRNDLCSHLRTMIAEQKRIDATYASIEGSIPSSQATMHAVEPRHQENRVDIRLILPPEPQSAKGTKGRPTRKFRHGTKSVYYDKTHEFALSTKSALPIIAVDLPLASMSEMTLHPEWTRSDERWKAVLADLPGEDRKYAETVREGVRKLIKDDGHVVLWLFNVREGRGFLMQTR